VIRQLPILSPQSADAAKLALAAAKQGKFAAFHHAMYAAGRLTPETMAEAAKTAGVDLALAQKQMAEPATQAEIEGNLTLARNLGLNGTPSWIAGGQVLGGAVGYDALAKALGATGSGKN
jgi:protein-disulfide isomerase